MGRLDDFYARRSLVVQLLRESPITSPKVLASIDVLLGAGEEVEAFDMLCSWIYEDELPIAREYYARIVAAADMLGTPGSAERLDELLID
ncbi:MafI family immunity protein [Streptomyces sp. RKAG293]|uniref:MafI family immunity protein n=1 Tax=Streptomyces sp. RKAG293 TaxID=2893403 RepID=UPI0020336991|nr:MafI family immunity protein [Streptomyces sp. RKAG293]MCM2419636.1 MafI family immunity protein [Streptomyces sp. RKAG293]